ncbi:unnamed protein product, partial [Hapterophycus canaliculatus]
MQGLVFMRHTYPEDDRVLRLSLVLCVENYFGGTPPDAETRFGPFRGGGRQEGDCIFLRRRRNSGVKYGVIKSRGVLCLRQEQPSPIADNPRETLSPSQNRLIDGMPDRLKYCSQSNSRASERCARFPFLSSIAQTMGAMRRRAALLLRACELGPGQLLCRRENPPGEDKCRRKRRFNA